MKCHFLIDFHRNWLLFATPAGHDSREYRFQANPHWLHFTDPVITSIFINSLWFIIDPYCAKLTGCHLKLFFSPCVTHKCCEVEVYVAPVNAAVDLLDELCVRLVVLRADRGHAQMFGVSVSQTRLAEISPWFTKDRLLRARYGISGGFLLPERRLSVLPDSDQRDWHRNPAEWRSAGLFPWLEAWCHSSLPRRPQEAHRQL